MDEAQFEQAQRLQEDRLQQAIASRVQYQGESAEYCDDCGVPIPQARRLAVPGSPPGRARLPVLRGLPGLSRGAAMSSDEKILPCQCGYEGALLGTDHGAFYSLQCPECSKSVEAFTIRGLGEAWNEAQQGKEQGAGE